MTGAPVVTSNQVRAYRILASGLDRSTIDPKKLPLWDLGIQDRDGSTRLVLAARLADPAAVPDLPDPGSRSWSRWSGPFGDHPTCTGGPTCNGSPRLSGPPTRPTPRPGSPVMPADSWATAPIRSKRSPWSPTECGR
jgi:hypothetical protein